jgi:hypothetical protein
MFTTKNLILACHITGIHDVNRNNTLADNDISLILAWAESIKQLGLSGIVFHNSLSASKIADINNEQIRFIEIPNPKSFNPNVYRYFIYRDFLLNKKWDIENVFLTDITDVTVAANPFIDPFFIENTNSIFCGDEPKILNNEWMFDHSTYFRNNIPHYPAFEENFKNDTLLNCGIIGGNKAIMLNLVEALCNIHATYNKKNNSAFTGDMGAFNFIVRTKFNDQVKHGAPINTLFKSYENERTDCWFRHK